MARSTKKRGRPRGPRANKSDFVRKRPNLSAAQIVEAAKAAGFSISPQLVYRVRSRDRANKSGGGAPRRKRTEARLTARGTDTELVFRRLTFELTLPRAREIVDELERGLRRLIAG
jgi:hypothetical protein